MKNNTTTETPEKLIPEEPQQINNWETAYTSAIHENARLTEQTKLLVKQLQDYKQYKQLYGLIATVVGNIEGALEILKLSLELYQQKGDTSDE